MNKLIICTVGTSISNGCPSQRELLSKPSNWNDDTTGFEKEISDRVSELSDNGSIRAISAEINSVDRLKIGPEDKIVLLSSDNAPGKACSKSLQGFFVKNYKMKKDNVTIERIEGLQVYDSAVMKKVGLKNFVSQAMEYIGNKNLSYQYDVIINPTGGFKGVLPFLTILGMLYGKKIIYIFEHSEELIYLPPLPFTFDLNLFERAKPALKHIENAVAIPENEYFAKIVNYTANERELFLSFVEPFDDHTVTISPLAHSLIAIEDAASPSYVLKEIYDTLKADNSIPALSLQRLIKKSSSPLWRSQHSEAWRTSDLTVLKQPRTAERVAGFIKGDNFYITHALKKHDVYERVLKDSSSKDYQNLELFCEWVDDTDTGKADEMDDAGLLLERDELLIKLKENEETSFKLEYRNKELEEELNAADLKAKDLSKTLSVLELELQKSTQAKDSAQMVDVSTMSFMDKLMLLFGKNK